MCFLIHLLEDFKVFFMGPIYFIWVHYVQFCLRDFPVDFYLSVCLFLRAQTLSKILLDLFWTWEILSRIN